MDQITSSPNDTLHITVSIYSMLTACNGNVLHMFHGNFSLFYGHDFQQRVKGNNDFFHYDLSSSKTQSAVRLKRRRQGYFLVCRTNPLIVAVRHC